MIDGTNYKTAYVSGMKEEVSIIVLWPLISTFTDMPFYRQLNLNNNELNFMDIYFRIGYAIFLLPCQIILTRVRPRWFLPSAELAWGLMTGKLLISHLRLDDTHFLSVLALMAAAKNVKTMYALRFFIGVFEASSYPGIISVLCNW